MKGKRKFIVTLIFIFSIFILFQLVMFYLRTTMIRDESSLLNQYYLLQKTDPDAAKRALDIIIKQYPHSQIALREAGFWYLKQGDSYHALDSFIAANKNDRNDMITAVELAKLYKMIGSYDKARHLLMDASNSKQQEIRENALVLLSQLPKSTATSEMAKIQFSSIDFDDLFPSLALYKNYTPIPLSKADYTIRKQEPATSTVVAIKPVSERDRLLNEFYQQKKINPALAWRAIKKLLSRYPNDVNALKEAGYFALSEKNNEMAFYYLDRAYRLSYDAKLALQNGYILNDLKRQIYAYYYFSLATITNDLKDKYNAEIAMTNLRGYVIKLLPDPFFWETSADPIYISRFQILVQPVISHLGVVLNEKYNWQLYLNYRRTTDNRSSLINGLPQIYDDNVVIYGIGSKITPVPSIPIAAFIEAGRAQDLVYRQRPRWRPDFRTGLALYTEWGREPTYTFHPCFPFKFNGDIYGDAIYFSRYRNNIFTLRARPGFKIFRYGTSSIDIYLRGFISEDTQRQFFNNFFEYGPGVQFIPNERLNLVFRYEFVTGHYLPASSPGSPNPYGQKYHNNNTTLNFFIRF